jgi:CYTH domain-containing protein
MYSNAQIEFALKNIDKWSEQATQIFKDEIINVIQEDYKGFLETIKVYQTVLKYAREALTTTIKGIDNKKIIPANADAAIELWRHKQQINEAIAEIDKAIGDVKDV